MKPKILKIIQVFITIALLFLVVYQAGLFSVEGRANFVDVLKNASLIMLVISVITGVLINMSSAFKWYMLTRSRGVVAGYWRMFSYYLIGQFYNLILPTSVGGDVVRSYELGKYSGNHADAVASVIVERYSGVLVLLFLSGVAVLSRLAVFNVDYVIGSLIIFTLILGFIAWMVFDVRLYKWFRKQITDRLNATEVIFLKVDKLLSSIAVFKNDRSAIIWALFNSLMFYFIAVVNVYVTALVFTIDVNFIDILIATPIIMLIMNIPLSIGNLGLMEFAYINVFQLSGYNPALGLSVAILMRLKSLIDGAMGGVLHQIIVTQGRE